MKKPINYKNRPASSAEWLSRACAPMETWLEHRVLESTIYKSSTSFRNNLSRIDFCSHSTSSISPGRQLLSIQAYLCRCSGLERWDHELERDQRNKRTNVKSHAETDHPVVKIKGEGDLYPNYQRQRANQTSECRFNNHCPILKRKEALNSQTYESKTWIYSAV